MQPKYQKKRNQPLLVSDATTERREKFENKMNEMPTACATHTNTLNAMQDDFVFFHSIGVSPLRIKSLNYGWIFTSVKRIIDRLIIH